MNKLHKHAKGKKPDTKRQIFYDFTHLDCLEEANSLRQEADYRFTGARVQGHNGEPLNGHIVSVWIDEDILEIMVVQHCDYN